MHFRDIIGQPRLARRLETHLNSAVARGAHPGHVLLDGGPGHGKTTLARAIGTELTDRGVSSTFHEVTADAMPSVKKLIVQLAELAAGDVLFIDQVQALRAAVQIALYKTLEDGCRL